MVSDSGESRKVDKRTALALWDTSTLPGGVRKRRADEVDELSDREGGEVMKFTLISKKGSKTQVCTPLNIFLHFLNLSLQSRQLPIPASSALAIHTRSAQLQDRVEQQHLKQFVLDYEQREEIEELKGWSCLCSCWSPILNYCHSA